MELHWPVTAPIGRVEMGFHGANEALCQSHVGVRVSGG